MKTISGILTGIVLSASLTACTGGDTGPDETGHYVVDDLASHLQMCQEWTTELERPACIDAAYATWSD